MKQFRVHLTSISQESEEDVVFTTLVAASNEEEALAAARERQLIEQPDLHPARTWAWSVVKTAEKP